jgi:hypothetical protein
VYPIEILAFSLNQKKGLMVVVAVAIFEKFLILIQTLNFSVYSFDFSAKDLALLR